MTLETVLLVASVIGIMYLGYTLMQVTKRMSDISNNKSQDQSLAQLHQRLDTVNDQVTNQLNTVTQSLLNQLSSNTQQIDKRLTDTNMSWQKTNQTIQSVTNKLSQLEEANKRIYDVGKDISSLQEILKAPKLRGTLGELFLGDLLSQIVPADRYTLQHHFKSGETVDALLKLRDGQSVPIDAKFPLESFQRLINAETDEAKKLAKREFVVSVKKRIDEIASKYIVPDEGTLDFALMYIPAENVYYETIIKADDSNLVGYAYAKRVIPVSPNSLYVYLQTISLGLRGMQIEERAKEILADLSRLQTDYVKVTDSYEVLGKHISNASGKYEETLRIMGKFGDKVDRIEDKTEPVQVLGSVDGEIEAD